MSVKLLYIDQQTRMYGAETRFNVNRVSVPGYKVKGIYILLAFINVEHAIDIHFFPTFHKKLIKGMMFFAKVSASYFIAGVMSIK